MAPPCANASTAAHVELATRRDQPCAERRSARSHRSMECSRTSDPWPERSSLLRPHVMKTAFTLHHSRRCVCPPPHRFLVRSGNKLGDKPWLRECCDVNLRGPILGFEAARLAITLRNGLNRVPPDALVVARYAHCHVAADIDWNGRDVATRIREQATELEHGRSELIVLKERNTVLGNQHAAGLYATAAAGIKLGPEQYFSRTNRISRIHDNDIEAAVSRGDIVGAVFDYGLKASIGEDRLGEFGKMSFGEFDDRGIDLNLSEPLHGPVLEHFLRDAAIAAADDQDIFRPAMGEQRHMRHHLLIDEFVFLGDLRRAVEHQHFAEEAILEQYKMLVLGLQLIEHPINLEGHAESEIVEKRFGDPALLGRVMRRLVF